MEEAVSKELKENKENVYWKLEERRPLLFTGGNLATLELERHEK